MESNAELLNENARLLLARELVALRRTHARVSAWLAVAHGLSELVSSARTAVESYTALSERLMSLLELQRVAFFQITRHETLRPLAGTGAAGSREQPLAAAAAALLDQETNGLCNAATTPTLQSLSDALGLSRFMWCRLIDPEEGLPVLMVAGYDAERSLSHAPFEEGDFGHFRGMGEQLALQLRNAALIKQLEREKLRLQELNDTLERRVLDRTEEIALANRELAAALVVLEDKDRRMNEDLDQARSFQQRILPVAPSTTQAEFAAVYRPLAQVGGDIYDITTMSDGHFRLFIADATGHGVQASLRTIVLKSELDRCKANHAHPDTLLRELNRRLVRQFNPIEMLCTACCFDVIVDDRGARLRYVNAAHPQLLLASNGAVRELRRDGPFLGLSEEIELEILERELAPGDTLIAYTDGLSDQVAGTRGPFRLGDAVNEALRASPTLPEALDAVLTRFHEFRGDSAVADDITVIGLRIRERA